MSNGPFETVPLRKRTTTAGGVLSGLRSFLKKEEQKLEETKAEVEERRAKLYELEQQYQALLIERDGRPNRDGGGTTGGLKNRLAIADAQFNDLQERRARVDAALHTTWWGNPGSPDGTPEMGYSQLLTLDAAIADYPNARTVIGDELELLNARIAEFEREHLS